MPEPRTAYQILHTLTNAAGEYIPVICTEGEKGYHPTSWAWGKDYIVAQEIADKKNAALGLTKRAAFEICASTY